MNGIDGINDMQQNHKAVPHGAKDQKELTVPHGATGQQKPDVPHDAEYQKKLAALQAVGEVRDHMVLGLGTGSTVYYLILELARRIREGLDIRVAATSVNTEELARRHGIPLVPVNEADVIHLAIDGVDAIDPDFYCIKGGGGALFREKVIASRAQRVIWIMDQRKLVPTLNGLVLPIEVSPFALRYVRDEIRKMGFTHTLRMARPVDTDMEGHSDSPAEGNPDGPSSDQTVPPSGDQANRHPDASSGIFITDSGNYILDLTGSRDMDYRQLSVQLKAMTGVLETGLFGPVCEKIIVGTENGIWEKLC